MFQSLKVINPGNLNIYSNFIRLCISISATLSFALMIARAEPTPTDASTATGQTASPTTTSSETVTRAPSPTEELNTLLMHATFLIYGLTKVQNQVSFGTIFLMGIPYRDNPKVAHVVLVTAGHVFDGIEGDSATLLLRRRNADGSYVPFPYQLSIRKNGQPLYVRHPTADVAAMYADIPDEVPVSGIGPDALVTDKTLEDIEFHPGDEAYVLGFPAMVSTDGGFPILRTGRIASYPLTPMRVVKHWAFDLHIFKRK